MQTPLDFFAIGDIVTEPFIRLKDARVHCNINDEECEICMRWGDKIPYESFTVCAAVGNASNAAVAAARLGFKSALRGYLGKDRYGEDSLSVLTSEHVDTTYIVIDPAKHSNYHYVLWYEDNRTILVKHEEYDYTVPRVDVPPKWVYLSSLAQNSLPYHHALLEWLNKMPETKLAFQPGTFQMKLGTKELKGVYERSEIFFCNKQEAERILTLPSGTEIRELLRQIKALGPKIVVITDDTRGAYAIDESGAMMHCPRYPAPRPPYEITGAGDAFASTTTIALSLGKDLGEALRWGATNASAVLQGIGAQKGLLTREELEKNLASAGAAFAVQSL